MANPPTPFNGAISSDVVGTYRLRVRRLTLGLNVVSSEAEGRERRVFYPATTTSSAFIMEIQFPSYESRTKFSTWLESYMHGVMSGRGFRAAMKVTVPSRNFAREAIPVGPVLYGEALTDTVFSVQLNFVGAADALDISLETKKSHSYFVLPKKGVATSQFFYPGGQQLTGAQSLEGSLFDYADPTSTTAPVDPQGGAQEVGP